MLLNVEQRRIITAKPSGYSLLKGVAGFFLLQGELKKEVNNMAVHHGGKVGAAAKTLASKSSSKGTKSKAGTALAVHKAKSH